MVQINLYFRNRDAVIENRCVVTAGEWKGGMN